MPEALRSWCLLSDIVRLPDNFGVEEGRMVRLPNNFGDEEGKSYRSYMRCAEKKAFGFSDEDEANKLVRSLVLEAQIAAPTEPAEPLGLSFLNLLGDYSVPATVYATDRNQLLILQAFIPLCDYSHHVFLIYDAIREELIMIPAIPPKFILHLTARVLVARPDITDDDGSYALVMAGKAGDFAGVEMRDSVFVWSPSRPSSWEEVSGGARFPPQCYQNDFCANKTFSFNGCCYWADLHCGGLMYCTTDVLLSSANCDNPVEFSFIDLPVNPTGHRWCNRDRVGRVESLRTIGFVKGYSAIKFISIDFFEPVDLENHTVTVWRLQLQDDHTHKGSWDKEGELSLEALWGLEGFNLPKDLTPIYPFLSMEDDNVIYFMLGRSYVNCKREFIPLSQHYLLCVDMRNKILVSSTKLTDQFAIDKLLLYCFTQYAPLMKKTTHPPTPSEVGKHASCKEEDGSSGESMDDAAPLATALIALQAAATEDDKKRKRTTESDQEVAQN